MQRVFFENTNSASSDYPYFDCNCKNINYVSHFHEEVEIAVVIDGAINIVCENKSLTAHKGDILIFMPGEIHSFATTEYNHLYIMKLRYDNTAEKINFSAFRIPTNLVEYGSELNSLLRSRIDIAAEEQKHKKIGYAYRINSIANEILCDILRSDRIMKFDARHKKRHMFSLSLLENVNSYIKIHYSEPISLEDISEYCNLSQYYFAHSFKEITNSTFYDYLTAYRLEKSLKLLLFSDERITDIAFKCGFSNVRSFNRAFKKFFTKTPSEYIKANQTE